MDYNEWEQELSLLLSLLQRTQNTDKLSGNGSVLPPHYSSDHNASHIHSFIQNVLSPFISSKQANASVTPFLDGKLYNNEPKDQQEGFFMDAPGGAENTSRLSVWLLQNASGNDDGCSSRSYKYVDFTQKRAVRDCFVVLYIIVIVLSVIGNLMVIYTVWRNKHMRTSTNYYIVNLAVCDFLVGSFVMPLKLLEYVAPCSWQVFGHIALCSIVSFILPVVVFASVLTLVAISIERHRRIMFPLSALRVNSKIRTRCILTFTWIVPLILASPYLFCQSYAFNIHSKHGTISRQICNDRFDDIDQAMYGTEHKPGMFRKGFFLFLFVTIYLIPMLVIVSTCVRIAKCLLEPICLEREEACGMRMTRRREESQRRIAKMVITVALSFIVCWSPFYWMTLVSQVQQQSFLRHSNFLFTMLTTHLIGFLNSAINPLIYHAMNERFRKSFRNILFRAFCCLLPLLKRRRQFSWGTRCDGMSAPYCGYVGSTLNSSNLEPPQRHKLHMQDHRFVKKVNNQEAKMGRPKGPQRYLGHMPKIVVAECSSVVKKNDVGVEDRSSRACKLGYDLPAPSKPRTASSNSLSPSCDLYQRSSNSSHGVGGNVEYLCTPQRSLDRSLLSPSSDRPLDGAHRLTQQHPVAHLGDSRDFNRLAGVTGRGSQSVCGWSLNTRAQRRWSYDEVSGLLVKTW